MRTRAPVRHTTVRSGHRFRTVPRLPLDAAADTWPLLRWDGTAREQRIERRPQRRASDRQSVRRTAVVELASIDEAALLVEEEKHASLPARETDVETIQLYIGVRYLLLAPLYGYSLVSLALDGITGDDAAESTITVMHDGVEEKYDLDSFRLRIRAHVREELDRVATGARSAIDLSKVAEAEA